jgi:CP family cyanate transporter-like MFS transporter
MQEISTPRQSVAAPASARRRRALLLAGLVLVSLNLRSIVTIIGPLIDDIRADLSLSRGAAGLLETLVLVAWAVVSPLVPRIARRYGSDRTLVAAMVVMAGALALRAVPSLPLLLAATFVAGCGVAVANVLMPALIKQRFPGHSAMVAAAYSMVLSIGAAIAAGLAVPSMGWFGGSWRAALAVWALPALLGALAWLPQLRDAPESAAGAGPREHSGLWRDRVAWQVTGFLACLALLFFSMTAWLPDVERAHGMNGTAAGALLSLSLVVGLPFGLVVGVAAQRLRDQRPVALGVAVPMAAGWLGVLLAPAAAPWLWASLLGIGFGSGFPLVLALMVLRAPDVRYAAELSGMAQAVAYAIAAVGPVAVGALHDLSGSWTLPLAVLVACTVPTLALGLGASRPRFVGAGRADAVGAPLASEPAAPCPVAT